MKTKAIQSNGPRTGWCVRVCVCVFGTFDMKILCKRSHAEQSVTAHSCCCDSATRLAHQWDILAAPTPDDDTIRCALRHRDRGGGGRDAARDLPGILMVPGRGAAVACRPPRPPSLKAAPPPGLQGSRHFRNVNHRPPPHQPSRTAPPPKVLYEKGQRSTWP